MPRAADRYIAVAEGNIGSNFAWQSQYENAITHFDHALEVLQRLLDANPDDPVVMKNQADFLFTSSTCFWRLGRQEPAFRAIDRATRIAARLADRFPNTPSFGRAVSGLPHELRRVLTAHAAKRRGGAELPQRHPAHGQGRFR